MATKSGTLGDTVQTDSSNDAISQRVIHAVADARGVDPLDLDPLYDAIDPDALDALFGSAEASLSSTELRFEFEGCEVLVQGNGEVTIIQSKDEFAAIDAESQPNQDASSESIEDRCGIAVGVPGQLDTHHA